MKSAHMQTYEVGLEEGITDPYPTLEQFVFSRTLQARPEANVTLVRKDAVEVVRSLKRRSGKAIWLCGGAELATTIFAAGLMDQLIVKLNPVLFGSGIPLLRREIEPAKLELTDSKVFSSGHVLLYYSVQG